MINLNELDHLRIKTQEILNYYGGYGGAEDGAFLVRYQGNKRNELRIVASNAEGWDHVSVSLAKRLPTYNEM